MSAGVARANKKGFPRGALGLAAVLLWLAAPARAQTTGQSYTSAPEDKAGGVLEIAPQNPAPQPAPQPNAPDQNADDQNNDIELYRTYSDSEHAAGHSGPLPYLGVSVHSITTVQPDGSQQRALEVLSVDSGSPAAAAGLHGSGDATKLGATTLTATALLGPAQELMAPLLQKAGQLGRQGDLIVAVDDDRVASEQDLAAELARLKPGDTAWLTVLRPASKGRSKAVKIPVKLAPPQSASRSAAK